MAEKAKVQFRQSIVVRFSGDSGDGMQLAGNIFSNVSAGLGDRISTFPDYPAEVRAPQGSLGGVSGFQVHIGHGVHTPALPICGIWRQLLPLKAFRSSNWMGCAAGAG